MKCAPLTATTPLLQLRRRSPPPQRRRLLIAAANSDQQLDLSVLRFTLGIPGLDESYLPRWIGGVCGSLIVLNHFLSSSAAAVTDAQMRSEALGLCLAGFSAALPYIGKFLKIIAVQDSLCVRGYWNTPEDVSKAQVLEWFKTQILQVGFLDLKDALYFPQSIDSQLQRMLPKGTLSLLVHPICQDFDPTTNDTTKIEGFVLLASGANYAYSDKDRAWIRAIVRKFQDVRNYDL